MVTGSLRRHPVPASGVRPRMHPTGRARPEEPTPSSSRADRGTLGTPPNRRRTSTGRPSPGAAMDPTNVDPTSMGPTSMDPTSGPRGVRAADVQCSATREAFHCCDLSPGQLWARYLALGGTAGETEVAASLLGTARLPAEERDLVAHAVNERLDELAPPRAPYSRSLDDLPGSGGPLASLLGVVTAAHNG